MKTRLVFIILCLCLVAILAVVMAVQQAQTIPTAPTEPLRDIAAVRQDISNVLSLDTTVALSSNPYDYVGTSPALQRLIARGTAALPVIDRALRESDDDGLSTYLLVIAAQRRARLDVAGGPTDSPLRTVTTARQWPRAWQNYRRTVPRWTESILGSSLPTSEKNRALMALGTPALPQIVDRIAAGQDELAPAAEALLQGTAEADGAMNVHVTPEWAHANSARLQLLRDLAR